MKRLADGIGDAEGRLDVCVAAAGVWGGDTASLDFSGGDFQEVNPLAPYRTLVFGS